MSARTVDDKYEIIRLLAEGGMGEVYEARQIDGGARVALKLISGPSKKDRKVRVGRFQREARAAGAIETPHIVKVLDSGTDPATGAPYIVMEYLEGEDLSDLLKRTGPLPPLVALRIAAQACLGLAEAHAARVVHRDIKPANVFLSDSADGTVVVKILDFGIAKIRPGPGQGMTTGLTATGSMLGTPLYMSPEQVESDKLVDQRTDIWSLGVVLYRALAGRAPHEDVPTIGKLLVALCTELPRSVQDLAPWVSPEIAAVVHGAIQFDLQSRFPSAAAMLDAIRPLLPDGWSLRKDELVPLTPAEREVVAPKLTMAGIASAETPRRVLGPSSAPPAPPPSAVATARASTPSATAEHRPPTRALLAVAATLAIGAGAYLGLTPEPASSAQTASAPSTATADPEPSRAAPGAVGERPPAPAKPNAGAGGLVQDALRRVRLVVYPSDASVELGGAPVPVQDGVVEIAGALGSVHRVRVFKGAAELATEVTVTEQGADPPKIDLGSTKPGAGAADAAKPRGGSRPHHPPPGAPTAPATPTTEAFTPDKLKLD